MFMTKTMLETHPHGAAQNDLGILTACVDACFECAKACTSCADACLAEEMVQHLTYCIRTNLDCADICTATGKMVARQTKPDKELMRAQLQACMMACKVCGDECKRHAEMHEHCRICAEACRTCEAACQGLLDIMPR